MINYYEKPITATKGKTSVTFAVAASPYNPDESLAKGFTGFAPKYEVYLKYENTWYFVTETWRFNKLEDLVSVFKRDIYNEEQFIERIFKYIGL